MKDADTRVLIRRCDNYSRDDIIRIITEGMKDLHYRPSGSVFVKPNVVFATSKGKYGSTAYTDPDLVYSAIMAIAGEKRVGRISLGEKTAIGYPTRLAFKYAGYYDLAREARRDSGKKVNIFCIDEERRDRIFIGGSVHDNLRIPRKMARADSLVYLPKLKSHCVSNMTGAVKLNIGICSDDERSIRHDFMLNHKITDLLSAGYPDFIVMDAIDVGVGNEAVPTPRRLGLVIMGRNPLAVDLVGARLLGFSLEEIPYLARAVECGFGPARLKDVRLMGDITTLRGLDRHAERIRPYDGEFYRWQDIEKELKRLKSPIRFYWGHTIEADKSRCLTGCIMGIKMFLAFIERFAGSESFKRAKPAVMVVGRVDKKIDARGGTVFMIGSCSRANIVNEKKVITIDRCFTTAVELTMIIRGRLGIKSPLFSPSQILPLLWNQAIASLMKLLKLRYLQDISHFISKGLQKRL